MVSSLVRVVRRALSAVLVRGAPRIISNALDQASQRDYLAGRGSDATSFRVLLSVTRIPSGSQLVHTDPTQLEDG